MDITIRDAVEADLPGIMDIYNDAVSNTTAIWNDTVVDIDNRRLARMAKLAGAPAAPSAGLEAPLRIGDAVERGQPLFTVHAQSRGELAYALDHAVAGLPYAITAEAT